MKLTRITTLFLALSLLLAGTAGLAETVTTAETHTHVYSCKYLDKTYHVYTCTQCGSQTKEKHDLTELGTCIDCNATGLTPSGGGSGSGSSQKKPAAAEPAPVPAFTAQWTDHDGNEMEVGIVSLGLVSSIVKNDDDEEVQVRTAELELGNEDIPEDKRLARLIAPKNGKVSIRKTEKSASKVIKKGDSGTIVVVLEIKSKVAKVYCEGSTGYVQLSSLAFTEPKEAIGTAVLHYKGKTNGKKRIGIHTKMDTSTYNVVSLLTGTKVTVISRTDHWSMVEYEGRVGYVQNSYLTMDEEE